MKYFNKKQIVSIEYVDDKEHDDLEYRNESKILFGLIKEKEGIYYKWSSKKINNLPNNTYIKNNIIYVKPNVIITFANNEQLIKYFNTIKERNLFIKRNFQIDTIDYFLEK